MFVYVCMCEQILETHRVYMMYLLSLCVLKWSPVMPCRMKKSLTTSDLTKRTNALSNNQSMSRISKPWSRLFTSNQSGSLRSSAKSTNNSLFEKNFTKYVTSLFIYGRFKQRRILRWNLIDDYWKYWIPVVFPGTPSISSKIMVLHSVRSVFSVVLVNFFH